MLDTEEGEGAGVQRKSSSQSSSDFVRYAGWYLARGAITTSGLSSQSNSTVRQEGKITGVGVCVSEGVDTRSYILLARGLR